MHGNVQWRQPVRATLSGVAANKVKKERRGVWRAANNLVACADERAQRGTRGGEAYRKTAGVRRAVEGAGAPGEGEPTRSHSLLSAQKILTGTVVRETTRQHFCCGDRAPRLIRAVMYE